MAGKVGVKESLELVAALSGAVDVVADKVLEDGQITLKDALHAPELLMVLKPGVEGVLAVKDELSELDQDEVKQVLAALVDLAVKVGSKFK